MHSKPMDDEKRAGSARFMTTFHTKKRGTPAGDSVKDILNSKEDADEKR